MNIGKEVGFRHWYIPDAYLPAPGLLFWGPGAGGWLIIVSTFKNL